MIEKLVGHLRFARKCLGLMAEDRVILAVFILLSILGALTEGVGVSLLVPILDSQSSHPNISSTPLLGPFAGLFDSPSANERIKMAASLMAIMVVFRGLLQYSVDALGNVIPLRLQQSLCKRGFAAAMAVELGYINEHEYGVLSNGVTGWAVRVTVLLTDFAALIWSSCILLVYLGMMVTLSWKLTLLAMVFLGILSLLLKRLTSGPVLRAGEAYNAASARLNQVVVESLCGMKVIHLSAAEPLMTRMFGFALNEFLSQQRKRALVFASSSPFLTSSAGVFIAMLLFGKASLNSGDTAEWLAPLLMFLFLMFRLLNPVTQINLVRMRIAGEMAAFESLDNFFVETAARRQSQGSQKIERLQNKIVLENVGFAYKQEDGKVIHDLSMTIHRGEMIAVVGPSGAGKTTLIGLLARLYDPTTGRIVVDGHDLRDLDLTSWRHRLAVVSQDIFIFNDTVAANIGFGRDDVSPERIREAACLAAADEFIEKLPDGYATVLGDRGVRLSGGQQQRIAIARAVLANPDLLIMDEATSHLDSFTERTIQKAVETLSKDRTLLVIAHRLSTIRKASRVIVMKDGAIVEEGRHEELLSRRGLYWEMIEQQRLDLVDES